MPSYTIHNYFTNSYGCFKVCKPPKRTPDFESINQWDEISSQYWYGSDSRGQYVIRYSDHWSQKNGNVKLGCKRIANCFWELFSNRKSDAVLSKTWAAGKCYLSEMKKNKRA